MADKENKVSENVAGKYYVDEEECTACGLCADTAPENIKMNDDDCAYVFKQPENEEEENACEEAKDDCPTEAIGDDG